VEFRQADIFALPFTTESFDHVFVCFVLEHLSRPAEALAGLNRLLRPGGTITVVEEDHGSTYFHPDSADAHSAIQCLVTLQRRAGGNALIGRQLYPLMVEADFDGVRVSPRIVYVDSSRPDLVDGFTRKTFTAMIEGIRESAIGAGLTEPESFDAGVRDLRRTTEADGVFVTRSSRAWARRGDARRVARLGSPLENQSLTSGQCPTSDSSISTTSCRSRTTARPGSPARGEPASTITP
jgi:SAM-dependent methyltransferase